jgi:chorismate mutase
MAVRGLRGATSCAENTREAILSATRELLQEVLRVNGIAEYGEIVSILFTTTPDLNATFPAEAARELGMQDVPLLCAREIDVPGRLPRCVRILMHLNTDRTQAQMVHVYLREAKALRPDVKNE